MLYSLKDNSIAFCDTIILSVPFLQLNKEYKKNRMGLTSLSPLRLIRPSGTFSFLRFALEEKEKGNGILFEETVLRCKAMLFVLPLQQ
jgi:hypothetical protein